MWLLVPGKENDGGAEGGSSHAPRDAGARERRNGPGLIVVLGRNSSGFHWSLRTAVTGVGKTPIFGVDAYGGELQGKDTEIEVIPRDDLWARFAIMSGDERLQMRLDRCGFTAEAVSFTEHLDRISFTIESRARDRYGNHTDSIGAAFW